VTVDNTVDVAEAGISGLSIYPNPGNGHYQVSITARAETTVFLQVVNLLGGKVYEQTLKVNGSMMHTLDLNMLPSGIYLLRMEGNGISVTKKIIQNN